MEFVNLRNLDLESGGPLCKRILAATAIPPGMSVSSTIAVVSV
jgi:hypothetical protein